MAAGHANQEGAGVFVAAKGAQSLRASLLRFVGFDTLRLATTVKAGFGLDTGFAEIPHAIAALEEPLGIRVVEAGYIGFHIWKIL